MKDDESMDGCMIPQVCHWCLLLRIQRFSAVSTHFHNMTGLHVKCQEMPAGTLRVPLQPSVKPGFPETAVASCFAMLLIGVVAVSCDYIINFGGTRFNGFASGSFGQIHLLHMPSTGEINAAAGIAYCYYSLRATVKSRTQFGKM